MILDTVFWRKPV